MVFDGLQAGDHLGFGQHDERGVKEDLRRLRIRGCEVACSLKDAAVLEGKARKLRRKRCKVVRRRAGESLGKGAVRDCVNDDLEERRSAACLVELLAAADKPDRCGIRAKGGDEVSSAVEE